jgi:hypothetical protein
METAVTAVCEDEIEGNGAEIPLQNHAVKGVIGLSVTSPGLYVFIHGPSVVALCRQERMGGLEIRKQNTLDCHMVMVQDAKENVRGQGRCHESCEG